MRGASLAVFFVLFAAAPIAEAAEPKYAPCATIPSASDIEGAKGLHLAAKQYLAKSAYVQAIQTWLQAYNFDCTKPEVFINIGRAYEGLGQLADAVEAYQTYADRKGAVADGATLFKLKVLRDELEAKRLATLAKSSPAAPLNPAPAATTTTTRVAGPGDASSSHSVLPWVLVGLGGAAVTAGGVLLGVGTAKVSDAEVICPNRNCDMPGPGFTGEDVVRAKDSGNQGLTYQRAGTGLLIGGLGAAAGGVVWYLVARPSSPSTSAVRVLPVVGPGIYGAMATLSF